MLVDAPCSGSGTLRRNPDLKWRFDERELARVNGIQHSVLRAAARLLKPGGRLVYATCSLLEMENQLSLSAFSPNTLSSGSIAAATDSGAGHRGRRRAPPRPWFVMLPHVHGTDGFFARGPGALTMNATAVEQV